jgi:succinate dehydrogenase/fumarate reductase cytochrome b subunit
MRYKRAVTAVQYPEDVTVLKILIILLMLALVISLGSGLYFLMVDQGNLEKKRLFTSLGIRLGLATALITTIIFGVATGQLGNRNPWDAGTIERDEQQSER